MEEDNSTGGPAGGTVFKNNVARGFIIFCIIAVALLVFSL